MKAGNPARLALLILNSLVAALAIIVICMGIWAAVYGRNFAVISKIDGLSIGLGFFILILCAGIFLSLLNYPHGTSLIAFGSVMVAMSIVAMALGGAALHHDEYDSYLANYGWLHMNDLEKMDVQQRFNCCGFNGPNDAPPSNGCTINTDLGCRSSMTTVLFEIVYTLAVTSIVIGGMMFFTSIPAVLVGVEMDYQQETQVNRPQ